MARKIIGIKVCYYLIKIFYIIKYRKSLNRSLPQIEACLKLTPGALR